MLNKNNAAPNINSAAYKLFCTKTDASVLDSIGQKELLELIIKFLRQIDKDLSLIKETVVTTQNYSFMHSKFNQIMIGFSDDWENRLKKHKSNGWILLGSTYGSLKNERIIKRIIKSYEIEPVPASREIFQITPELINLLINFEWVGIKNNKSKILKRHPQLLLDLKV